MMVGSAEGLEGAAAVLSEEQAAKVARKGSLVAELRRLGPILARVEVSLEPYDRLSLGLWLVFVSPSKASFAANESESLHSVNVFCTMARSRFSCY